MERLAVEEWFINRDAALEYLKEVAREIRWQENRQCLQRVWHMLSFKHVRFDVDSHLKTYWFHFEADRGRPNKGHCYTLHVVASARFRPESLYLTRRAKNIYIDEIRIPINCPLIDVTGELLLEALREYMVAEVMSL